MRYVRLRLTAVSLVLAVALPVNAGAQASGARAFAIEAVPGAAAGLGAWHLFTEELDVANSPAAAIVTYSVTQGLLTAAVSRLWRR